MKRMQFVAKSQILRALLTKMALSPPPNNSSSGELRWVDHMSRIIHKDVKIDINELGGCIFEVPKSIRSFKPEAYTPQLLALGPYHHFLPELYQIQLAKLSAAKEVLKQDQLLNFEQLMIDDLKELELPIRVCYNKYLDLDPNTLAWILAIDGLFLLHFFNIDMHNEDHFAGGKLKINAIIADIMMLENQIPIILLERIQRTLSSYGYFVELQYSWLFSKLMGFCESHSPLKLADSAYLGHNPGHLLDLMYHLIVNNRGWKPEARSMEEMDTEAYYEETLMAFEENVGQIIDVATDLAIPGAKVIQKAFTIEENMKRIYNLVGKKGNNSGTEGEPLKVEEIKIPKVSQLCNLAKIKFDANKGGIRDIKFDEKELTFYFPVITLNVNSEVILRNLVAYEVLSAKSESTLEFAQYVDLMSGIIDDAEDARLLREAGIIEGSLTNEEIASLFNRIDKVTKKPSEKTELEKIVDKTNEYFDSRPRVKLSNFMKKYFASSMTVLVFGEAIMFNFSNSYSNFALQMI
ncbi:hypothetical protein F0562_030245 [Nyssa sinensis]|uniref:Uncharacterized protein n=1 Tax=Nyssa sinensis TaxID=561372 RepID=A0A5J5B010_9ASTE|nr:hypothetical protein F0562_030245 [Nyssa sinensis]